jgi:hypothetical protein
MLEAWVKGEDTKTFNVFESDVQSHHAEFAIWLLSAIPESLKASGLSLNQTLADQIDSLKEKLKYGVPEKYLPAARVFLNLGFNPLSRHRIIMVGELHVKSLEDLSNVPHVTLTRALGSAALARDVLDKASKLTNDPLIVARSRLLKEAEEKGFQGPVTRLFNAFDDVEYENATYRILMDLTSLVVKPSNDRATTPDFIIAKSQMETISVVVKFSDELTPNDVGDAVTRSLSERSSIVTVIIGKGFSLDAKGLAAPKSTGSKVTLLTEAALVKILLLSKVMHPEALLFAALEAGGEIREEDVIKLVKSASYKYDPKTNIFQLSQKEKGPSFPPKTIDSDKLSSAISGDSQ